MTGLSVLRIKMMRDPDMNFLVTAFEIAGQAVAREGMHKVKACPIETLKQVNITNLEE